MSMNIATPALLFTTICLLLSAYIARFTKLSRLIRNFYKEIAADEGEGECFKQKDYNKVNTQISIFKKRISVIKYVHIFGVLSLFCSATAMFLILLGKGILANYTFFLALIFFLAALLFALFDIYYSLKALDASIDIKY